MVINQKHKAKTKVCLPLVRQEMLVKDMVMTRDLIGKCTTKDLVTAELQLASLKILVKLNRCKNRALKQVARILTLKVLQLLATRKCQLSIV